MKNKISIIAVMALIVAVTVSLCGCTTDNLAADFHTNEQYVDCTILGTIADTHSEGQTTHTSYVVVTDKGKFEVDRPTVDVFNSAVDPDTLFVTLQRATDKRYRLHTYGIRNDVYYIYPIIVDATPLP
jgi:hypothetical protein